MKNKILTGLASLMLMFSISTLKADVNVGASVMVGKLDTSGSETEITDLGGANDKNSKKYVRWVSCTNCFNKTTKEQKERYMSRQKQIEIANQRNKKHLGPKEEVFN